MDGDDPVADCKKALLDLSDGLRAVAETLRWDGDVRATSEAMITLGPMFEQVGSTMRRLPGGFSAA